jgi:hypothetical protein
VARPLRAGCDGWPLLTQAAEGVKKSTSSTQRHKDTKKDNKVICPGVKPGRPAACPKSVDSHQLLDDFRIRSFTTEVCFFLGAFVSLCCMALVAFLHTLAGLGCDRPPLWGLQR